MAGTGYAHLRDADDVLLRVEDLVVEFRARGGTVHAVSGISLDVREGETLGIVGESGCGKSTTGRAIMQLPSPTSGRVVFRGTDLTSLSRDELREVRNHLKFIFQDPISSLNPRRKMKDIVAEPLTIAGKGTPEERRQRVREVLEAVGLDPDANGDKRPHQFSGGQCQRISIARALVLDPSLVICDEPVSALDVSVQAQILNLMRDLQDRFGLTFLFISHNLAVVRHMASRIGVMYLGRIVEVSGGHELFAAPKHPYTRMLLDAVPDVAMTGKARIPVKGEIPNPITPPSGCPFNPRCPFANERCRAEVPPLLEGVACHAVHEGRIEKGLVAA